MRLDGGHEQAITRRYRTTNWFSYTASLRKRGSLLLKLADLDWAVADHTTLCRRQTTLAVQIPDLRTDGLLNLFVDSTGIQFLGDGEWHARKHGVQGRRQWHKVHLAMYTATSDIRAVEFTPSSDGDRTRTTKPAREGIGLGCKNLASLPTGAKL